MKNIYVLLVSFFFVLNTKAQTITVKDQQTNDPIEWATISSLNTKAFATTNAKGQANITDFEKSSIIQIRSLGYKMVELSFAQLKAADFVVLLSPSNLNLNEVVVSASR